MKHVFEATSSLSDDILYNGTSRTKFDQWIR